MFPYFPHWPSQSEGQWGKCSLYWHLMQEKHKFGDSQRDSCKDMTHIDLEIPHYLKGYVVVEALLPTSAYWNNQRKGKLNATLLRIQTESAVEIQGASVSHRSPEQPPKAGGLQPDSSANIQYTCMHMAPLDVCWMKINILVTENWGWQERALCVKRRMRKGAGIGSLLAI